MNRLNFLLGASALTMSATALATETVTYTYDARGRLVKVERAGTVNDGKTTEYEIDKADNREKVKASDTSAPPS